MASMLSAEPKMIKRVLMLLLCLAPLGALWAQAPISDEDARQKYAQCRAMYESGKFLDCFKCCEELKDQMGRQTPRVLSLLVRSGMYALPLGFSGQENTPAEQLMKLNYKNLTKVQAYVLELSALLNPADSNNINNRVIRENLGVLELKLEEFAHEKDRTPESAIKFLNECATKFQKNVWFEKYSKVDFKFSLIKDTLFIELKGRKDWSEKPKFRAAYLGEMKIPLQEVWIETNSIRYWGDKVQADKPFLTPDNSYTYADNDPKGPIITSTTTITGNTINYDKLLVRGTFEYNKNMEYPYEKMNKYYRFEPSKKPLYLFYFFNDSSEEYKKGNYRKRIEDTFAYLIETFGGGTPKQKTEKKSYF